VRARSTAYPGNKFHDPARSRSLSKPVTARWHFRQSVLMFAKSHWPPAQCDRSPVREADPPAYCSQGPSQRVYIVFARSHGCARVRPPFQEIDFTTRRGVALSVRSSRRDGTSGRASSCSPGRIGHRLLPPAQCDRHPKVIFGCSPAIPTP